VPEEPKDCGFKSDQYVLVWFVLLLFPLILLQGWVFSVMWGWFVVPLGAPAVGAWHAAGLTSIWTLLTYKAKERNHTHSFLARVAVQACIYMAILGIAWVIHKLMGG